jgi:hypothetical protein
VYINGYKYVPDKHGITTIRLEKFDATYQNFYVYAVDKAGNISNVNTIANPYWNDPNAEKDNSDSTENPAESLPDNATPKTTGEATAEVTAVTDEDGEDITEKSDRLDDDYILPTSDREKLTSSDIEDLSLQELNYAKNEIYARHGRKFASKELQNYFNSKSWYNGTIEPEDFSESLLSKVESANAKLLKDREYSLNSNGYPLDQ